MKYTSGIRMNMYIMRSRIKKNFYFIILLNIPDKEELEERKCQNEDEFFIGELQVHPMIKSKKFPCFRRNRRQ